MSRLVMVVLRPLLCHFSSLAAFSLIVTQLSLLAWRMRDFLCIHAPFRIFWSSVFPLTVREAFIVSSYHPLCDTQALNCPIPDAHRNGVFPAISSDLRCLLPQSWSHRRCH
jgi:hypothetical protein